MPSGSNLQRGIAISLVTLWAAGCGGGTPQPADGSAAQTSTAAQSSTPALRFALNFDGRNCLDMHEEAINANGNVSAEIARNVAACNAAKEDAKSSINGMLIGRRTELPSVCNTHRQGTTPFDRRVVERCDEIGVH